VSVLGIGALARIVADAPFNDRFAKVYGAALTPQSVTTVLAAADQGYLWALADMLDELRERDTHLHSVLAKREQAVAGAEWELRPPQGAGTRGTYIAKWCAERLREIEAAPGGTERSFPDALADLMGAAYHGRAGMEVVWRREGRYWMPNALSFVHPRRFAYATDWRLHLWDASGTAPGMQYPANGGDSAFGRFPGIPLDSFPAGKFVVHAPRVRGTYPTREGLGRTVCWPSTFKRFGIRDFLAFAEWAGRGLRIGTYSTGTDPNGGARAVDEDVRVLEAMLERMSSAVSAVIPDSTKLQVLGTPSDNKVHDRLVLLCNSEMSKAVLGETLTTEVGEAGGNRALGQVHDDVRLMLARADARSLGATLRRDLLRPMVQRTWGDRAPVPEIAFATDPKESLDAIAGRYLKLAQARLPMDAAYARKSLSLPEPEEGAQTFGGATAEPEPDASAQGEPGAARNDAPTKPLDE
jgi:phage gp29-like protein